MCVANCSVLSISRSATGPDPRVDTRIPGLAWRKRDGLLMARKAESRRDAVELYRSTPTATVAGIAADLGTTDTTLSEWINAVRGGDPRAVTPAVEGPAT